MSGSPSVRHDTDEPDREAVDGTPVDLPLVVDLDGTLLRTDTLLELYLSLLFASPIVAIGCLRSLLKGRAAFKSALLDIRSVDPALLPLRGPLLHYLRDEKRRGREVHLVSAANQAIVDRCRAEFGIFDSARGSCADVNLKGLKKLAYLRQRFAGGFVYAGDSTADLVVWQGARGIVLAGASAATADRARALGVPIEREFETGSPSLATWVSCLRPHQWSKNLLLFVPLLLSSGIDTLTPLMSCLGGFLVMCVLASATYVLNDIADLESDRRHASKRFRAIASGEVPLGTAVVTAIGGIAAALPIAAVLSPEFAGLLLIYLGLTLCYSFGLKRVPVLDAMTLAVLYSLRLSMGVALAGTEPSAWLLTFSAFFFFSMSLAKRHVEIDRSGLEGDVLIGGRGYMPVDAPLVLSMGVSSSVASVLVIIQYLMTEAFQSAHYGTPGALWLTPMVLTLWIGRVWLLAVRGQLDQDPVAFAVRDRISWQLGAGLAASVLLARLSFPG